MYVHVKNRGLLLRLSDKSNNTLRPIINNVLSIKLKKNNDIQTGVEKHILKNCKENSITSMPSDLLNVTLSYLNYKDWFKLIFVTRCEPALDRNATVQAGRHCPLLAGSTTVVVR